MGNEASVQAQAARADELALMQALLNGDLQAIQALSKQNPSLVYLHSKAGENLWHFAAQGGDAQVLKVVAAAVEGALAGQKKQDKLKGRINHEFNKVNQAVNQAISSAVPLPAAIAIPMSTDIGINAKTMDGITPLMAAVKAGKPEAVAELLAAGADPRRGDSSGATALHHAAWQGQGACLEVLLQHGQQQEEAAGSSSWAHRLVDVTTNTGLTPLHYAAWKGPADIFKQLVNAGASLAVPSVSDTMGAVAANAGSTPLHLAAMKGDAAIVRLLLRANLKLMALAAAEGAAGPLASAPAASGARGDVRKMADKYGKTAANLAWDMQRSDLALILDPSTPLEQAIELAAAAAKAGPPAAAPAAAADAAPAKGPLPRGSSSKFLKGGRRPGEASVDSGPSTPVAGGSSSMAAAAGSAAAGLQRLGLGRSSSRKEGENGSSSSSDKAGGGGGIFLPPPKAWKSRMQMGQAAGSEQQQQQKHQPTEQHERGAASRGDGGDNSFGSCTGAAEQQHEQQPTAGACAGTSTNNSDSSSAVGGAAASASLSEPPAGFVCPITNELLKDPVRACDGLAYEREAIEVWFQLGNSMMPGGHSRISSEQLTPDAQLREAIAAWKAAAAAAAAGK